MENGESEGDIEDDTRQTRYDARIESHHSLSSVDGFEAVGKSIVFMGVDTLHLGLDDIDGIVCHC